MIRDDVDGDKVLCGYTVEQKREIIKNTEEVLLEFLDGFKYVNGIYLDDQELDNIKDACLALEKIHKVQY
jgi:hypothetical protein